MIEVYKGLGGYKEATEKNVGTHVLLTKDEYDDMLQEIEYQKNKAYNAERKRQQDTQDAWQNAKYEIQVTKNEAAAAIQAAQDETAAAQADATAARALNDNLIRICRENANSKRGLQPKKRHSGYMAIKSSQAQRVWYEGRKRNVNNVWRTIIQTPYSVQLSQEQAHELIAADIKSGNFFKINGESLFYTDWSMTKNLNAGLWEISLDTKGEYIPSPISL